MNEEWLKEHIVRYKQCPFCRRYISRTLRLSMHHICSSHILIYLFFVMNFLDFGRPILSRLGTFSVHYVHFYSQCCLRIICLPFQTFKIIASKAFAHSAHYYYILQWIIAPIQLLFGRPTIGIGCCWGSICYECVASF